MRGFIDRAAKQDDAADVILFHLTAQLAKGFAVLIQKSRVDADRNKLTDLFIERHPPQFRVRPFHSLARRAARVWLMRGETLPAQNIRRGEG
jgi:hypothetical protein